MKLERIKRRSGGTLVLEITPLIDVVFLLLIFFMLATSFDERSAFKIDLPKSTAAKTKSTLKEVQVLVDKDRNVYLRYTDNSGKSQNEKLDLTSFVSVVSEKLNNCELVIVESVGHSPFTEKMAKVLIKFLEDNKNSN